MFGKSEKQLGGGEVKSRKIQVSLCDEGFQHSHGPKHGTVRFART